MIRFPQSDCQNGADVHAVIFHQAFFLPAKRWAAENAGTKPRTNSGNLTVEIVFMGEDDGRKEGRFTSALHPRQGFRKTGQPELGARSKQPPSRVPLQGTGRYQSAPPWVLA